MKKILPVLILAGVILFFFKQVFLQGLLPIPADTIVGLYHPFRDLYAKDYPRGVPFKNFLITDPVRQQIPWRMLSINLEKKLQLPQWNPYTFAGSPLLANMQSAPFYPLNIFFFLLPFSVSWTLLVILEPFLAGCFMFLYLREMRLSKFAGLLGAIAFSLSGFSIAWMEWNTVLHVVLWLPLILFVKEKLLRKWRIKWVLVFLFSEISAFLGGHLQVLFYAICISNAYLFARIYQIAQNEKKAAVMSMIRQFVPFLVFGALIFAITSVQWIPAMRFIFLSARGIDQSVWQQSGWFIPWQNIVQFIAPDFFGNPATLNYWGVWNYAEFIGYVGIFPLLMGLFALFFRRDKKTLFFGTLFIVSLLFAFPTPFAKIPYMFRIPLISTSQPTRLLFVTDFSLSILAALGFDAFQKNKKKFLFPAIFVSGCFLLLWVFVVFGQKIFPTILPENIHISKSNLLLPTVIFIVTFTTYIASLFFRKQKFTTIFLSLFILITIVDLLRFGQKFTPFTEKKYLFPETGTISFLQKNTKNFRIMETDPEILPPNFSVIYKLQSIDGYDPLFLQTYAEFIAASQRKAPNIQPPFGFNRIITPHITDSPIINLLGVKYILSLHDLHSTGLTKVFEEGETKVYENSKAFPRAFFVKNIIKARDKQDAISMLFRLQSQLSDTAVVMGSGEGVNQKFEQGSAEIQSYSENSVTLRTKNSGKGFLVLTDSYYPTWKVTIDGAPAQILLADYTFRGLVVPAGSHIIIFSDSLF